LAFRCSVPLFQPHAEGVSDQDAPAASVEAAMEIKRSGLFPFGEPRHAGDGEGPSNIQVLLSLVGVALTLIGGLFSRDEAHQHAPFERNLR
jgi:hypothetical protein